MDIKKALNIAVSEVRSAPLWLKIFIPVFIVCLFCNMFVLMVFAGGIIKMLHTLSRYQTSTGFKILKKILEGTTVIFMLIIVGLTFLFFPLFGPIPVFLALPFVVGFCTATFGQLLEEKFPFKSNDPFKECFYTMILLTLIALPWQTINF